MFLYDPTCAISCEFTISCELLLILDEIELLILELQGHVHTKDSDGGE